MMSPFDFCLSGKLLISPSILKENLYFPSVFLVGALFFFSSVQFSSVTQSCLTLCYPMNCSMPSLPVHHQLPQFTQTHVHLVGDAIQPSHPPSSPSSSALNLFFLQHSEYMMPCKVSVEILLIVLPILYVTTCFFSWFF